MTPFHLLLRNLLHHWRGNLAVFLGVVVGAAVLTGALLVGDSLRGSLSDLAWSRLFWIDDALIGGRFFREKAAEKLPAVNESAVILLRGTASVGEDGPPVRQVNVVGVNSSFWRPAGWMGWHGDPSFWNQDSDQVALSKALAAALRAHEGDKVRFRVGKTGAVPPESLLGRRDSDAVLSVVEATVLRVFDNDEYDFGNHFSLAPTTEQPLNAFFPLKTLQKALGQEGRVNIVLIGEPKPGLQKVFQQNLTLEDWGLVVRDANSSDDFFTLNSRQLLIEPAVEIAAMAAAKETELTPAPTLVYLADTLSDGKANVPYVIVAALDPTAAPPLGPFLPKGVSSLKDDEIILAEWPGSPLTTKPGDTITLTYYPPEQHGEFKLETAKFKLAGVIPMAGPAADPGLTPELPGVTDKTNIRDWNPPFPYDNSRIKPRDESFWNNYRATPRAYVNLAVGQKLWGSRFGQLTSIRLASKGKADLQKSKEVFEKSLLARLNPEQAGLVFQPVKEQALKASNGSTDFAMLFVCFSGFLIVAALLLVGLLFRLNLDRRATEFGLLTAIGYRPWAITRLMLGEGVLLAVVGTLVGCVAAVAYAALLVQFLGAIWPGGALQSFLRPHYTVLSFVYGGAASLVVSVLTILWSIFSLGRVAPSALLAGQTTVDGHAIRRKGIRWSLWIAIVALIGAVALSVAGWYVPSGENQAMTFFGAGALLLTACLAGAAAWMGGARHALVEGGGWWGVSRLGVRNAARHRVRSLLTAGMLASAAFLIVSVEAFRQQAAPGGNDKNGPAGGFALVADSDLPIVQDLNSDKGRSEISDKIQLQYQHKYSGKELEDRLNAADDLLSHTTVYAFRVHAGDDISCLNLYEPHRPRLLGVPAALIDRGGFRFAETDAKTAAESANPWLILQRPDSPFPSFGEQNSVVYVLNKNKGDVLDMTADDGATKPVRIDGLLDNSVFQSGLLLSEEHFLKLYPTQEGYQFFLIETPPGKEEEVRSLLNTALADRGFEAESTAKRLQAYLAVENTYLSTFQALGGLGLILGSLGLAVVLLRSVWERRGELALLRALGFRRAALIWLVLAENGFLLLLGLAAGTISALAAAAPHLVRQSVGTPWLELAVVLTATAAVGLIVGAIAAATALRAPLVAALRHE
jgi:putative ABC transport system permease protein